METITPQKLLGGHRGRNILGFYPDQFQPRPSPIDMFRRDVTNWFFAAKHLRLFEAYEMSGAPSPDALASHRLICTSLIGFGEFASNFAKQQEKKVDLPSLGITIESIEAETRLLRYNFKMFHDDTMSDAEAESVLAEANGNNKKKPRHRYRLAGRVEVRLT